MTEWWRGAVIYQIYPRSFKDSNGDGVGDLPGITEHLGYVASLGVDGIWISPFFPSPMKDFGYDVADYEGVDPIFGTLEDFRTLLARAHELGLKVIIDQVYSHTSNQHVWFQDSRKDRHNPKADWYVWADPKPDGTPPNNWLAVFGGPSWDWEPRRRQYYFHNFLREQPDLNLHNPEVQQAILSAARFWLGMGVDGFRLDVANFYTQDPELRDNPAVPHPNPIKPYWMQKQIYTRTRPETLSFISRLRHVMDEYQSPERMAVAEIASHEPVQTMVQYTHGPDRLHTAYSFVFLGPGYGAGYIRHAVEDMLRESLDAWPSWAFSNHDVIRVATRWGGSHPSREFVKMAMALLVALRGTVFVYQGEELGLPQSEVPFERLQDPEGRTFWPEHKGRDGCRTPMPWHAESSHAGFSDAADTWLPVEASHLPMAVNRQEADPESALHFTRRLLRWRKAHPCLIEGGIRFIDAPEPVLAFERHTPTEQLLCAFNLGEYFMETHLPVTDRTTHLTELGLPGELWGNYVKLPPRGAVFARLHWT